MAAIFHLTKTDYKRGASYAIEQGASFENTFWYEEDLSGWIPRGQIRDKYLKDGGEIKAEFSFDPLVYEEREIDGVLKFRTKIRARLTATQTERLIFNLRVRRSAFDKALPGRNCWVYDIELEHPLDSDRVIRLVQGFVEVDPEATD